MSLARIRIVLVRPQHPGNIGAVARAMKNMGLSSLVLVAPREFPAPEAVARAAGADDILASAQVAESVAQAVAPCTRVFATSARARKIPWPVLAPEQAAGALWSEAAAGHEVALLFGGERSGLANEDVDFAQGLVQIPVDPAFPSLNLAAAAQVLCYEIRRQALGPPPAVTDHVPTSQDELNRFFAHLETVLIGIGFLNAAHPRKLMRRLVRLFRRATPDQNEINILRGILTAIPVAGQPPANLDKISQE
ncbi:MAG: RNA methyltransferase [Gammaproteobacteria bacterium]|nr:RNA methyltransferase [Gammaproteobacteria bacterium]